MSYGSGGRRSQRRHIQILSNHFLRTFLRKEGRGASTPELLPVHRAFVRIRYHLRALQWQGLLDLQADGVARDRRRRHGEPTRLRGGRLPARQVSGIRVGVRSDPARHDEVQDFRYPPPHERRSPFYPAVLVFPMKYSYHWLKELSGTKKSPDQLAKLLMMHAFEVESVEKFPHGLSDIVIGEVAALAPHPNADRLRVATVCTGKDAEHTIVCGAPNIEAGQKVAVALPGTVLPGGMEIGEAKLRGVLSQGMICSERELGLSENHEGILVLPEDAPTGALFAKHYKLDDSILDIKILPDRGSDALSYEGMAREIAALDGHAPRFDEKPRKIVKIPAYNRAPKVLLADKKACSLYVGLSFRGVKTNDPPLWQDSPT